MRQNGVAAVVRRLSLALARLKNRDFGQHGECRLETAEVVSPRLLMCIEFLELCQSDGRLNFVHSVVVAQHGDIINARFDPILQRPVIAKCLALGNRCRHFVIVGGDHTSFNSRNVLDRVE